MTCTTQTSARRRQFLSHRHSVCRTHCRATCAYAARTGGRHAAGRQCEGYSEYSGHSDADAVPPFRLVAQHIARVSSCSGPYRGTPLGQLALLGLNPVASAPHAAAGGGVHCPSCCFIATGIRRYRSLPPTGLSRLPRVPPGCCPGSAPFLRGSDGLLGILGCCRSGPPPRCVAAPLRPTGMPSSAFARVPLPPARWFYPSPAILPRLSAFRQGKQHLASIADGVAC